MQVSHLAQELGVNPDTVRYYTREGFIKPAKNRENGYKEYSDADKKRLKFILSARQLGFSVDDIGQILAEVDQGNSACGMVRELIACRLEETEKRYRETVRLRKRMRQAVQQWKEEPQHDNRKATFCPLIESFFEDGF